MKWFKHLAGASSGEDIVEIESLFGLEGYARFWKLLEAVALQMDKTDSCSVAYPWAKWQEILRGKRKKLETFLEHLEKKQLIFRKQTGEILEIKIPKLLKYRDEYSKKSGQTPDKLRTKEEETDKEVDTPLPPQGEPGVSTPPEEVPFSEPLPDELEPDELPEWKKDAAFVAFWAAYPSRRKKKAAVTHKTWKKHKLGAKLLPTLLARLEEDKASPDWTKDGGAYIPGPDPWLNACRWLDDPGEATSAPAEPARRETTARLAPALEERWRDRPWWNHFQEAQTFGCAYDRLLFKGAESGRVGGAAWKLKMDGKWDEAMDMMWEEVQRAVRDAS